MRGCMRVLKIHRARGQTMVEKYDPRTTKVKQGFGKVTLDHRKPSFSPVQPRIGVFTRVSRQLSRAYYLHLQLIIQCKISKTILT